jgi:putative transposase
MSAGPDYQRGLRNFDSGLRNGYRPRRAQTAEGELKVEIPQVREAAEPFVSALFPHSTKLLRTRPLEAMVVGAFVRGLSMRDVESLCEEAGLGKLSKSTASRICTELRERFEAFKRRDLYRVKLVALFLDAIFLNVRPKGPKEGVLCAWGFTDEGERVLVGVCLGMRESHEDWLGLARDLIARGLAAPMLVVADGAPGLIKAVEQCWPASERQHCSVHRARNLIAKLPEADRERVRRAYWKALDEATDERDAKERLEALASELERAGFTSAARCLADDLDALVVHLRYPLRHRKALAIDQPARANARRGEAEDEGDRAVPRRGELPLARLGGPRPADQQRLQRGQALADRPPTALPASLRADGFRGREEGGGSRFRGRAFDPARGARPAPGGASR